MHVKKTPVGCEESENATEHSEFLAEFALHAMVLLPLDLLTSFAHCGGAPSSFPLGGGGDKEDRNRTTTAGESMAG